MLQFTLPPLVGTPGGQRLLAQKMLNGPNAESDRGWGSTLSLSKSKTLLLSDSSQQPLQTQWGKGLGPQRRLHHGPDPESNLQTVILRTNLDNSPSHPLMKCHRPSQRYLFLLRTTSLNYLNGQNKTATYLWLFFPSSVTETHILTPSYWCPKYMKPLSPTQQKRDQDENFSPYEESSREYCP